MELKQEDLFNDCEYCSGSGKEPSQTIEGPIRVSSFDPYSNDCRQCGGTGIVLTDLGKIFKAFFEKLKQKGMI